MGGHGTVHEGAVEHARAQACPALPLGAARPLPAPPPTPSARRACQAGISVYKEGKLTGDMIEKDKLIDNHYYAIANKASSHHHLGRAAHGTASHAGNAPPRPPPLASLASHPRAQVCTRARAHARSAGRHLGTG